MRELENKHMVKEKTEVRIGKGNSNATARNHQLELRINRKRKGTNGIGRKKR